METEADKEITFQEVVQAIRTLNERTEKIETMFLSHEHNRIGDVVIRTKQ